MADDIMDIMERDSARTYKRIALILGMVVYGAGLVYTGMHNWQLFSQGLDEQLRMWALVGVLGLEFNAVALPLALHWWMHSGLQRAFGLFFYALDLGLLMFNVVADFALRAGGPIPGWLDAYLFIAPATPVIALVMWAVLWLLDPEQQERAMIEQLRSASRLSLAQRIGKAAAAADIDEMVQSAADEMARNVVGDVMGVQVGKTRRRRKAAAPPASVAAPAPIVSSNGHHSDAANPTQR